MSSGFSAVLLSLALGAGSTGEDSWLDLDRELARLESAPGASDGVSWGALLRAFYLFSGEESSGGNADTSGFAFEDVDLYFAFDAAEFGWRVSADAESGSPVLQDAHAYWRHAPWFVLTFGQFKPRVVRSGSIAPEQLLFRERTFLGAVFDVWDDGVELGGHYDQFDYWLALTDAENGHESDHFWSLRGEWALYDVAFADLEGAREAPNHLRVLLGGLLFDDVALSASDGGGFGFDLALTFGPYAFHGEWARLDESFLRSVDVFAGAPLVVGDGQPRSATLSRRIGADGEAALRLQKADDADDTSSLGLCWNWARAPGSGRWIVDLAFIEGDGRDDTLFSIGLNVGTSGLDRPFAGATPR